MGIIKPAAGEDQARLVREEDAVEESERKVREDQDGGLLGDEEDEGRGEGERVRRRLLDETQVPFHQNQPEELKVNSIEKNGFPPCCLICYARIWFHAMPVDFVEEEPSEIVP